MVKKLIFDFGANKGQNLDYFFSKADIVIAVEANNKICRDLRLKYKNLINNKLFIENVVIVENKSKKSLFYISKKNDLESTLTPSNKESKYPGKKENYFKTYVKSSTASKIIKKYSNKFKNYNIEYVKIDIEGGDEFVLSDMFENKIYPKYLSVECHFSGVLINLIKSPYKFFSINNENKSYSNSIKIINKYGKKNSYKFSKYSSGPFGTDIINDWCDKKSLLNYFVNNGFGWIDIHCSRIKIPVKKYLYDNAIHAPKGFSYFIKNLIPSLFKSIKNRLS